MEELSESSSSIPSTQPPVDHQSPDCIDDQLNALSLKPQNDADHIGGDGDRANSEERGIEENEEEKSDNEVENVSQRERVNNWRSRVPIRPEAEDCSFYIRTGMCKFGMSCKFNHPLIRKTQFPLSCMKGAKVNGKEESVDNAAQKVKENDGYLDKEGQIHCKYFDRPGGCKFGKSCKFNHSRKTSPKLELNFMGLAIRLGEKECPYYMRNGSYKYGANCRFNHPDPTSIGGAGALPAYSNGDSILSSNASQSTLAPWSPPASLNENPTYRPLMFPVTQGAHSLPEWTAYQAPVYPTERNMNLPPAYAMNSQSLDRNVYTHRQEMILVDEFPERHGQPECSYFLKSGNCKYRSACKFHHPKSTTAESPSCTLSDLGLPLRPGESVCSYYNRYGICKYGPACKYDHPVNYAHSAPLPVSTVDQTPVLGNSMVNDGAMAAGAQV